MYAPSEIARRYSDAGAAKTRLHIGKMFVLAVFAGIFIALGAFGSQVVSLEVDSGGSVGRLMSGLVFPIGLMMVIIAGAELFTGNSLILISVLDKKATITGMLKNWLIVYIGNFAGSLVAAALLAFSHSYSLFGGRLAEAVVATAQSKVGLPFSDALLKGILCNILVCIAVWISFSAEETAGKVLGLFLPITLFVVSGYEHCVANMYFIPAGILAAHVYQIPAENLTWGSCILNNLIPVTIGNVLGGAIVVSCGYYYAYLYKKA